MGVIDPTPVRALDVLNRAADAVADVIAANTEWGPSGRRDGQYVVDLAADQACLDVLYGAGLRVLSEESGVTSPPGGSSAPIVVVDPLDGSTNASRGVPWYASALCVVDEDGPAAAVVLNLATSQRYEAVRGEGARRDGVAIRTSGQTELSAAVVGVSGLPSHHYGWAQYRAMGASAPDICAVADGTTDAWCDMWDNGHGVWDYLASLLILTEAGGVAAEALGRELCVLDHTARRAPVVAATQELLDAVMAQRLG
jgi:myo-inositol-1(or 4)-monophosphatase